MRAIPLVDAWSVSGATVTPHSGFRHSFWMAQPAIGCIIREDINRRNGFLFTDVKKSFACMAELMKVNEG